MFVRAAWRSLLPLAVMGALWSSPAAALAAGGGISGKVTEVGSHDPIEGIEVCAETLNPSFSEEETEGEGEGEEGCAKTNAGGEYAITGLNAGSYDVSFSVPTTSTLNFIAEMYDGKTVQTEATPVTVAEGASTPNIDAELEAGAELSGTLTRAGGGSGLEGAEVCAVRPIAGGKEGELVACTQTGAGGSFTLAGVPAGSLDVVFIYVGHEEIGIEFYGGGKTIAEAKPIAIAAKEVRTGLDQTLTVTPFPAENPSSGESTGPSGSETSPGGKTGGPGGGVAGGFAITAIHGLSLADTRVAVARGGKALVKVACGGNALCHGKLALREKRTVKRGHKVSTATVTIGAARYSVKAGGTASVRIELDLTGREELRVKRGKLDFHLSIVQISPAPSGVSVKDVVLLEAHKVATKR